MFYKNSFLVSCATRMLQGLLKNLIFKVILKNMQNNIKISKSTIYIVMICIVFGFGQYVSSAPLEKDTRSAVFEKYFEVVQKKSLEENVVFKDKYLPGDAQWQDAQDQAVPGENFAFDGWMRVDEAATQTYPIEQGERFVTYNNQEDIGGYEGALVMKNSRNGDVYRIMFSSMWDEVVLWSSRGGILAVKPYTFEVGQTYRVLAAKQGNNIKVLVNRRTIIDMYDQTAPIAIDRLGVAAKEGQVYFGPLRTWELGPPRTASVPHVPNFALRTWKGITWGFDGDEPIFALPRKTAFATEVKIVPGYKAQLAIPWYVQNWVDEPFKTDVIVTTTIEETGTVLRFTLTTKDEGIRRDLLNETAIRLTYNAAKNVYEYDHESRLIIPASSTLRMGAPLDVVDPLYYQIVPSASTYGPQWPVAHRWGVYQQLNGNLYKQPINHFAWYPGWGSYEWWNNSMHYMKPDGGTWTVMGDPIANPSLQWLEQSSRKEFSALLCWWGYDLHFNWMPGDGSPTTLSPGTYTFKWRLTSLPKNDTDAQFTSSTYAFAKDLNERWLVYTGGVGNIESFDKTVLKASPFGEFVWGESIYQSTSTGKDDTTSLAFMGPDFVQTTAGESQFTEGFEPNTDYEISAWIKTENVQGEGPGIVFSGQPYYPGITSTHDWQRIGFVARPQDPIHTVPFSLHHSGSGRAWFDKFQIRAITPGNPVTPGLNNSPKPLTTVGSVDANKLLNWQTSGAVTDTAKTVLDLSGHGNHAVRQNVGITSTDGHNVFYFPGNASQILMRGHQSVALPSPATFVMWIKPGRGVNGWNVIASGGPKESDRWRLVLSKTDNYFIQAHLPTGIVGDVRHQVIENQWSQIILTDDGTVISLYLNGNLVGTKPSSPNLFGVRDKAYIRLGAMAYGGEIFAPYEGSMSQVKMFNTAWSATQVTTDFARGPFAL